MLLHNDPVIKNFLSNSPVFYLFLVNEAGFQGRCAFN